MSRKWTIAGCHPGVPWHDRVQKNYLKGKIKPILSRDEFCKKKTLQTNYWKGGRLLLDLGVGMKKNAENGMMGKKAVKAVSVRGKVFAAVAWVAMSFAVTGMLSGCSSWFEGDVEWDKGRSAGQIVGFIDDSLVVVSDYRGWHQDKGDFIQDHGERSGVGHQRLRVYNYRVQEDGPRWTDSLGGYADECDYALGQLNDSVIWGGGIERYLQVWSGPEITFWKIGGKPYKMKVKKKFDGCSVDFTVKKMHVWLDGKLYAQSEKRNLNAGGDTCQYAVLDTN